MQFIDNRYVLKGELGRGSMGVVYRAYDRLTGQDVALKHLEVDPSAIELNPGAASYEQQHIELAHEFRLHASLRHPRIISVLDYGFTTKRQPFFVMEYLEDSQTIREAAQERDSRGIVDLLIQTLQAISYMHRHGILHRDLKPSNILVDSSGQVKVLDFGIAMRRDEKQELAGTVFYMAPEVITHELTIEASDLYSVGVVAYEMFTLTRPFAGMRASETIQQIVDSMPDMSPFEKLALSDPLIDGIAAIIARLLAKNPDDRYPDALSVIRALCWAVGDPLPPDEGSIRESFLQAAKFVGREDEMGQLTAALTHAKRGKGSVWLVGGESGVGKSRLLDELRIQALTEGAAVLRGQVVEDAPFHGACWSDILRSLILSLEVSGTEARVLRQLIPDLDVLLGRKFPDEPPFSGNMLQLWITVASVITKIKQPTLLLVEDLQWANESLEPLKLLLPAVEDLPLLIVGSYRIEEKPRLPEKMDGAISLRLGRLSDESIADLSSSMLGEVGSDPRIVDLLRQETEGNTFFMVEVVRALAEEAGQLNEIAQIALPDSVLTGGIQQIVRRRLNSIPDWAYSSLQVAALMGRQLDLLVLDRILSPILNLITGEDISVTVSTAWRDKRGLRLDDWLLVCADAAILEIREGVWRFSHDKLREQILVDLSEEQAQMLRIRIKRAVKAVYPER